jgi:hypothetical protein
MGMTTEALFMATTENGLMWLDCGLHSAIVVRSELLQKPPLGYRVTKERLDDWFDRLCREHEAEHGHL